MEFEEGIAWFIIIMAIVGPFLLLNAAIETHNNAKFVCQTHGLELIDYETGLFNITKVECGNKKPELQYDRYKVFTK